MNDTYSISSMKFSFRKEEHLPAERDERRVGEARVPRPDHPGVAGARVPRGGDHLAVLRLHHQELEHAHHLRPQGRVGQPHYPGNMASKDINKVG